ncbi:MAG: chemotaxis protein CheA, partial [Candidatus Krumholzibacteria bacterium]|nr:chemotaxis protein CheA [Candidatus Krumholzibacteria bacterium]
MAMTQNGNGQNQMLEKNISQLGKITKELQDRSMALRMMPIKQTFQKMVRLVRDSSKKMGKKVNLVMRGEDTELDKTVVEQISDPLVHMLRNCVDHGIDAPEERRASGKPETGEINLEAFYQGDQIKIRVKDDGRGLNRERIIEKAVENGLLKPDAIPADSEIYNLIFEPGFSTAEVVTDISGRGVGMDVVRRNIDKLRGKIDVLSEPGKGTSITISLPLTLAIIDGMVVRVGSETYVIPTVSIVRSIKPGAGDISTVLNRGEMLTLPSGLVPLYRMDRLYHIEDAEDDPDEAIIVIVEDEARQAGLVVDELVGRQQVVIKSLGESLKDIPGISGGAIMPDGRVGLIIDVGGLIKFANNGNDGDHREEAESSVDQTLAA